MKEKIPKESETIAAKRVARTLEKIKESQKGRFVRHAWWNNGPMEAITLTFIFVLNLYLVSPFFTVISPQIPFSGPVIPFLAKLLEFTGIPMSQGIHYINIFFALVFPLSFYFFIKKVSGRKLAAMFTLLIVSLPIFPFAKTRLQFTFLGTDGPHISSLSILPFALYTLLFFLREGGIKNLIATSASSALVVLISPFGFLTYLIFASITAFSEMLLGKGRLKIARLLAVLAITGGLTSFWYNPAFSFWIISGPLGADIRQMVGKLLPMSFFIIPILGVFGYLLFDRKPNLQDLFLASFYTITFGVIVWVGGGFFPSHPNRYIPEFGISLSFLLGILTLKLFEFVKERYFQDLAIFWNILFSLGFLFLVFLTITLHGNSLSVNSNVLGIWTGVEKGDIWLAKETIGGAFNFVGYTITGVTVASMAGMTVRRRGKNEKNLD